MCEICKRMAAIERGEFPAFILALRHSHVILGENQGLPGWCVLYLKTHHEHLADLPGTMQAEIFDEVMSVAAAIRRVFPRSGKDGKPPRINYECLGNLVPHIHWHVIPRHANDPEPTSAVWGWRPEVLQGTMSPEDRKGLIQRLRTALESQQ